MPCPTSFLTAHPELVLIAIESLLFLCLLTISYFILKRAVQLRVKLIMVGLVILGAMFFGPLAIFGYFLYLDTLYQPIAGEYFNVNAAIKNTCFLDPQQNHCPHHADDIVKIEPQTFIDQLKNTKLTYSYYPETNDYTLIIRRQDNRVAIFDSRIPKVASDSPDFMDATPYSCDPYAVDAPYGLPGPWTNIN